MTYRPNPLRPDPKPKPEIKETKSLSRTAKPKSDLPMLVRVADSLYSTALRMAAADSRGMVQCVTCPEKHYWSLMHCGHFVTRGCYLLRWSEVNTGPQCPNCNIVERGNLVEFAKYIDKKHGNGTANRLLREAKQPFKLEREFVQEVINKYKAKKK